MLLPEISVFAFQVCRCKDLRLQVKIFSSTFLLHKGTVWETFPFLSLSPSFDGNKVFYHMGRLHFL